VRLLRNGHGRALGLGYAPIADLVSAAEHLTGTLAAAHRAPEPNTASAS
jgi:hypothetical protein